MFLNVLGFLAAVVVMLYLSSAWCFVALFGLGEYNIGGAPNSWIKKIVILAFLVPLIYAWYKLFQISPFHITLS
jgi:hypothetical protein